MRIFRVGSSVILAGIAVFAIFTFISLAAPNDSTIVLKPSTLVAQSWGFGAETGATGAIDFVFGPTAPPTGTGSVHFTTPGATDGMAIGTNIYTGTALADITRLEYSTYRQAPDDGVLAVALQINVDYDLTDVMTNTWQGRLVYEPYHDGTVLSQTWQTWDTLSGAHWWSSGTPVVGDVEQSKICLQSAPCTWTEVLATYPNAGVQTVSSGVLLKAGSSWAGFEGHADELIIGVNGTNTTFDFEPETPCADTCYVNGTTGDDNFGGDTPSNAKATIQAAVDQVNAGGDVIVAAGIYTGNVTISKHVSILGAGSGIDAATNTVLREDNNGAVVTLQSPAAGASAEDPILLQDLRIEPQDAYGINVVTAVSFVKLENVHIIGTNPTNDTESEVGLKVATAASLTNLEVNISAFDNLTYGWYFAKHGDWGPGGSIVSNVVVSGTTFSNNDAKGIYVEKLSEATFQNSTVHNNGLNTTFFNARWHGGFDINLKGEETYQNLTFSGMTFSNNGLNVRDGAALMIKARDDGGTYGLHPATLSNVTIQNSFVTGNERGIRFGEPDQDNASPTNVVVTNNFISGNVKTYTDTNGSAYGGIINYTQATVNAVDNYWGADDGPGVVAAGSGDEVTAGVTYDPWLCDGTDTSAAPGFQPNAGQLCQALYLPIVIKN